MSLKGPDFFIVGAPKCGTTALDNYLGQHPDIFMAHKEIHYFGSDLGMKQALLSPEQYLLFFKEGQKEKLRGEASVWYLYSKKAAAEIKAYNPGARIIIMIRDPVEVIYSLHGQHLHGGDEDIMDFEEALKADELPGHRSGAAWANFKVRPGYFEAVKYKEQIERYWQVFGKEKVHLVLFDDFVSDTPGEYQKVLRFLNADETFVPVMEKVNESKTYMSYPLHRFFKQTPPLAKYLLRALIPSKNLRERLSDYVYHKNIKEGRRPSIDNGSAKKIVKKMKPEILELQDFLKTDLRNWLD